MYTIQISDELGRRLIELAQRLGCSVNVLVEQALTQFLEEHDAQQKLGLRDDTLDDE